ncbi:MAG TPA: S8 family serine peptidase [Symbiobacteriaceae bacterium]|nr:S8 family serine peptidase [Symbiobacteriaceae bacterium]
MKKRRWLWIGLALVVVVLLVGGLVSQTPWGKAATTNMLTSDTLENYGKDPGLGVRQLHKQGYTGKGVTVAIIDQPMRRSHPEYRDAPITYYAVWPDEPGMKASNTSMHGPAVTSLLMGKSIGVAPDVTLHYVAMPSWAADQAAHAEALYKLIEVNRSLPEGKKIRAVSISDGVDEREKNPEAFRKAIADAEAAGIWVFTVDFPDLRLAPLGIDPYKDKDKPANYRPASWVKGLPSGPEKYLWFPTESRTRATEMEPGLYHYDAEGGMSWGMPYLVGVVALGLQEDPALTRENAVKYLWESATPWKSGRIINPPGFVEMVKKNKR